MGYWEYVVLLHGRQGREGLTNHIKKIAHIIQKHGCVVARIDALGADGMGPRKLARMVHRRRDKRRHLTGYYVQYGAFANPKMAIDAAAEIQDDIDTVRMLLKDKGMMEVLRPTPSVDAPLPKPEHTNADPLYELKNFMQAYQEQYPQGERIDVSSKIRDGERVDLDPALRNLQRSTRSTGMWAPYKGHSNLSELLGLTSEKRDGGGDTSKDLTQEKRDGSGDTSKDLTQEKRDGSGDTSKD